jgi:hypothetical protein
MAAISLKIEKLSFERLDLELEVLKPFQHWHEEIIFKLCEVVHA